MIDTGIIKAAIEAQFLMGHCVPGTTRDENNTITAWSWDVDQVRQQLAVPLNALWEEWVFELELQGLASFIFYTEPVEWDEEGNEREVPGWEDEPRDNWGFVSIHPDGILRLAELYGRPYVRLEESPALLAHWQLVQAECEARQAMPHDNTQWEAE
jgi:hypothetical protein